MSKKLYLPYSTGCFVYGNDNINGLQVIFYTENNQVKVDLNISEKFNSYKGVIHGGIQSALLDEAMGWMAFIYSNSTRFFFTRELTIIYKRNIPNNVLLFLSIEFICIKKGDIAFAKGKITDNDGRVLTLSKGLFFPATHEKMEETKEFLIFNNSLEYHPKSLKYCKK